MICEMHNPGREQKRGAAGNGSAWQGNKGSNFDLDGKSISTAVPHHESLSDTEITSRHFAKKLPEESEDQGHPHSLWPVTDDALEVHRSLRAEPLRVA